MLTYVTVRVVNPAQPRKKAMVKLLVDLGAIYSVIPSEILSGLGIKSHGERTFILADGTEISRRVGDAIFFIDGNQGASPVIFGESGDAALLGVVTLEAMGLTLDPIRRVLRPRPLILGRRRRPFS